MSNCVTTTNFVAIGETVVEISRFWIFQDGGSHHLGFYNFTFLMNRTVKKDELRHCAKFCRNRSNHGGDISFRFFKMAAAAILNFRNFKFLTVGTIKRFELHDCAKFRGDRSNHGRDISILDFLKWRLPPSWIFEISNFKQSERSRGSNCVIVPNFVEID